MRLALHILFVLGCVVSTLADETADGDVIRKQLAEYHAGAEANGAVLRVVYFRPAGVEPQADYEARIHRTMMDNQAFLRDEMARHGFEDAVLPLEMADGKVRVHMVVGKDTADEYSHKSGSKTKAEMREALKDVFELTNEYVLVFHGMCRIEGERKYYFYAPYYGDRDSNHQRGLCHVADCEILDPDLLTDVKRKMSYKEHYGEYTHTVAAFNTKYLGGVIHELGHGLGLPHNGQTKAESRTLGTALMGAGNHTHRRERWSNKKGTFMTFASALRLASHPLFTKSDRGRDQQGRSALQGLQFGGEGSTITIRGKVKGTPHAYAVIAYLDPDGGSDYDAVTSVSTLGSEGMIHLTATCVKAGKYQLRLAICHLNGAVSIFRYTLTVNDDLRPNREEIKPAKRRKK